MTTIEVPKDLRLDNGAHDSWEDGACLLEACAYLAGEPWSDHPQCVSPVLGEYGRGLNDCLPADKRQRLVPLIPRLIGTAGDGKDERRSYLALDWLIRTYFPALLRLMPELVLDADAIAGMRPITDLESAAAIGGMVPETASRAAAAWDAAWAVRDAAGTTAWDAAVAAWDAARAAAYAAASTAAWDAGVVAWDTAGDVAWAASHADGVALASTVDALQDSAIELFSALIEAKK